MNFMERSRTCECFTFNNGYYSNNILNKICCVSITNTTRLMLLWEIVAVYSIPRKCLHCVGEAHGLEYSSGWYIYLPVCFKRLRPKFGYRYHKCTEE